MAATFFITLREGLEAALIIVIVLVYLRSLGRTDQFKFIFLGTTIAIVISILTAFVIFFSIGSLQGTAKNIIEGIVSVLAAVILTWVVFWMRDQSKTLGLSLRNKANRAIKTGSIVAMISVVFFGVLREGVETGLFLIAVFLNNTNIFSIVGSVVGLIGASIIGYLVYKGSRTINLRIFFQVTGGFIILVAAGMLSTSIHEFQEAGVLNIYLAEAWNLSSIPIVGGGQSAAFLKSFVGWRPDPSVGQAFAWTAYLLIVTWLFYFPNLTSKKRSSK